jgi:hypothetical protein
MKAQARNKVSVHPSLRGRGRGRVETSKWTRNTRIQCSLHAHKPTLTPTLSLPGRGAERLRNKFSHVPTRLGLILALVGVALGAMVATVAWAQPGNPDPAPDPGTHSAPATTGVSITYDESIDAETVTSHTFAVHGMQTGLVTGVHSVQDSTILVTPINPFHPGELVQATATTHTASITGQHPLAPTVWQFRVAASGGSGLYAYGNNFGPGDDLTVSLAMGDVDGDGDLDLITGNAGGVAAGEWNVISLNSGAGAFPVSYSFGIGPDDTSALALGDVDGDGDLDVAVGNHDQQNRVYLNDGNGNPYDTIALPFGTGSDSTRDIALADMDGDGDLDLVAGNYGAESVVYLNDGDGTFDTITHTLGTSGNTIAVAVGDVDGDGDLDVAVGKYNQPNVVCINAGDGTFPTLPHAFGTGSDPTLALEIGDMDGDGYLDLAVGNTGEENVVYLNDGDGTFDTITHTFGSGTGLDQTYDLAVGDVDGDGDLDLAAAKWRDSTLSLNDGDGTFDGTPSRIFPSRFGYGPALAFGDVEGDGDLDLAVGNQYDQNVIYLNPSLVTGVAPAAGSHTAAVNTTLTITTSRAANPASVTTQTVVVHDGFHGHLDGAFSVGPTITFAPGRDLHPGELVQTTVTTGVLDGGGVPLGRPYVWQFRAAVGDSPGQFTVRRDVGPGNDRTYAAVLGDVDGDGRLDLATGGYDGQTVIYINDGSGNPYDTIAHDFCPHSGDTVALAMGDVDKDGDLDLIIGNYAGMNVVCRNIGGGHFDAFGLVGTGSDLTMAMELGDVDGDGDLDLAVGNYTEQDVVYLNDGDGTFDTISHTVGPPSGTTGTEALALGDVDGDGDLDLAVGKTFGQQNLVYLNDGDGSFDTISHTFGTGSDWTYALAMGDLNGDGYLDLAVGNIQTGSEQNAVYTGNGDGTFANIPTPFGTGTDNTYALAMGDVDGDGDLDLAVGKGGQNAVYFNDGDGTFDTISRTFGTGSDNTHVLALGDVDGDGSLDMAVGNTGKGGEQNAIYLNRVDIYLPFVLKN